MLPFVAPLRAAAPPRDFTGEVRQQKKTEAAVRDIARDEATDDPAAPPREGDEPSGANPPELEPEENAAALLDTAKGLSFDTRRQTLSTRTLSSASARASFNAFFARRTRSLSDFVEARVEGRYRKVHFFFASYAAALLLLDYASRLAAAVRYVDEADSDDVFGSALFFGPARRAAPGPSMLCKLALVALVARPHRARPPSSATRWRRGRSAPRRRRRRRGRWPTRGGRRGGGGRARSSGDDAPRGVGRGNRRR